MEMDELAAEVDPQVKPTLVDITFVAPKVKCFQCNSIGMSCKKESQRN